MNFNLSNEEYYCEYWRQHYENAFSKLGLTKVKHKNHVQIGHYDFATKIAYGFPHSYAKKKFVHDLYKNEYYYPKSISFNKESLQRNTEEAQKFFNGSRKILKNNNGVGSKTVYIVNSVNDCLRIMNSRDYYILQEEIIPLLHNGYKLDERVYLLVVKEDNNYSAYTFEEGHIKLAGFKFNKNSNSMGIFATNIKAPKPNGSNGGDFTIDTNEFLSKLPEDIQNKWRNNRLNLMKKIAQKFIPKIKENTKRYYQHKKEPRFIWHMYGLDILIDENYGMYLCEFNGKPGVIYDKVMPRKITNINRKMCDRILMEFLLRWMVDLDNRYTNDKTIIKLC